MTVTILVAEDEPLMRERLLGMLARDMPWPFAGLVAFWGAMLFVLAFAFVPRSRLVAGESAQAERAG